MKPNFNHFRSLTLLITLIIILKSFAKKFDFFVYIIYILMPGVRKNKNSIRYKKEEVIDVESDSH